jgi:hypothetical protein
MEPHKMKNPLALEAQGGLVFLFRGSLNHCHGVPNLTRLTQGPTMPNLPEDPARRNGLVFLNENTESRPDSVEYQHSLLCALTLPRSNQPGREFIREYQGRSLKLEAGELYDGKMWIPQPLPYGPKARLAFMHICTEAMKAQSRFIEIERSARAFMERIGLDDGGSQYRLFRKQMNALSACRLKLGYIKPDGRAVSFETKPIEQFEAWVTRDDENQPALWASCLTLSEAFYQDLIKHAVPLSANALRALSNSALALDYYGLFAYRLHALEKPLFISWQQLHEQIGQEYADAKDFKRWSLPAIKATLEVYPSAKVEQIRGGLILKPSPPPIARQAVGVSRGLADKVKASLPTPAPELPNRASRLHYKTIEKFKDLYPRKDVYGCEADFRYWLDMSDAEPPRSYDAAFLGFAKKWNERNS